MRDIVRPGLAVPSGGSAFHFIAKPGIKGKIRLYVAPPFSDERGRLSMGERAR